MTGTTLFLLCIGGIVVGHLLFYHFNNGLKNGYYHTINLAIIKLLAVGVVGITALPGIVSDEGYPVEGLILAVCSAALFVFVMQRFEFNKWWYLVLAISALSIGDCIYHLVR